MRAAFGATLNIGYLARRLSTIGSVLAAIVAMISYSPTAAGAQSSGSPTGITVAGYGESTAPAASVDLQILITRGENFGGPPVRPKRGAEPGAEERELAAPVVEALVAKGVVKDAITIRVSPTFDPGYYGPGGPVVARLDFTVAKPELATLTDLVATASTSAADQDLSIGQVGMRLNADDCKVLERRAREAAIADARESATVQAELLDLKLGDVTASSDMQSSTTLGVNYIGVPVDAGECAPPAPSDLGVTGLTVTFAGFDPTKEPEVEVYSQVMLTFAVTA